MTLPAYGDAAELVVICEICRFPCDLDDPDTQVPPPAWICGECHRAREFDELLWEADDQLSLDDSAG